MATPISKKEALQGRVHRPRHRVKVPEVLRYANAVEEFREETGEHINWANALVDNICWGLDRKVYTPVDVYRELRDYHGVFRALLDAMLKGEPAPGPMQVMTEHCGHIRRTLCCEYDQEPTDDRYWEDFESEDAMFTGGPPPALRLRIRRWVRPVGGLPATDLPEEPPSYEAFWHPEHPVDAMCEQLRLLCEKKTIEFLRKCHRCGHYFLALTARDQSY